MKAFTTKKEVSSARAIVADNMILTKDMPTTAGSKMLDGYMSLFDAEVLTRLYAAGYELVGKADVGEFAFDLLGETSYNGAIVKDGKIVNACAEIISSKEAMAAVTLDVNGSVRRAAAQSGLVSIKPTYGTVSRYGTIPVACSGETVSFMSASAKTCEEMLKAAAGHDNKDGTSLPESLCAKLTGDSTPVRRVAIVASMNEGIDADVSTKLDAFTSYLKACGIEVITLDSSVIKASSAAWNILMSAELCNNVSRYDGVKYGYRAQNFMGIDELYTNSRTEAFGDLLKTAIIFGSETLSTDNYMKVYDKALRTRRVISEEFSKLFESFDAVLMPACSKMSYTESEVKENNHAAFEENFYTAPASVTGLPAVTVGGVQLVGKAFSDLSLLDLAKSFLKEVK